MDALSSDHEEQQLLLLVLTDETVTNKFLPAAVQFLNETALTVPPSVPYNGNQPGPSQMMIDPYEPPPAYGAISAPSSLSHSIPIAYVAPTPRQIQLINPTPIGYVINSAQPRYEMTTQTTGIWAPHSSTSAGSWRPAQDRLRQILNFRIPPRGFPTLRTQRMETPHIQATKPPRVCAQVGPQMGPPSQIQQLLDKSRQQIQTTKQQIHKSKHKSKQQLFKQPNNIYKHEILLDQYQQRQRPLKTITSSQNCYVDNYVVTELQNWLQINLHYATHHLRSIIEYTESPDIHIPTLIYLKYGY